MGKLWQRNYHEHIIRDEQSYLKISEYIINNPANWDNDSLKKIIWMEENKSQIVIYQTENGETKLDVRFQDETVWLTQKLMAELFQTTVPNSNMHLKNIFEEHELDEKATIKDFLIVQKEGSREVKRNQVYYRPIAPKKTWA